MTQNSPKPLPPVPASYGLPFLGWLDRLNAVCTDPELPQSVFLAKVAALADELPTLSMDWVALANHLESAMGQAALSCAIEKGSVIGVNKVNGVSTFDTALGPQPTASSPPAALLLRPSAALRAGPQIAFAPLADAIAKLDRRTPVGAKLTSAQWSRVALELRERAFFSARMENIRFLAATQDMIHKRLSLVREELVPGRNVFVDRGAFILAARKIAEEEGLDTTDNPSQRGTIRDIRSTKRLGLIYDMQTNMAQEYARWHMDHDADVLDAYPAQRFERIESRIVPRPVGFWEDRWAEAGDACGWQGALERPMVALKTSPIWQGLSIFGTPWPPFDYGSGWGVVDVDREESDALGLTRPALPVPEFDQGSGRAINAETGKVAGFNDVLEASVKDWRPDQFATLKGAFGDQVKSYPDRVAWSADAFAGYVDKARREPQWNPKSFELGIATPTAIDLAREQQTKGGPDLTNTTLHVPVGLARHFAYRHGVDSPQSERSEPMTRDDVRWLPNVWRSPAKVRYEGQPDHLVFWGKGPEGRRLRLVVKKTGEKAAEFVSANMLPGENPVP